MSSLYRVAFPLDLIAEVVLILSPLAIGIYLVIRDTIRQRGKWGINWKPAVCMQCDTSAPLFRKPANRRQALWGGWTCAECGFELDKWGRPVEEQNTLAKWAVLRVAEKIQEREYPAHEPDERIREANNQTQRGDVL
jgi:hypothetical protein